MSARAFLADPDVTIHHGDALENEQVRQWAPLAYKIARDFYLPGADREDTQQEALLGLLRGLRSYRPELGGRLQFLAMAIRRHLFDALRSATTDGRKLLTDSTRHLPPAVAPTDTWALVEQRDTLRRLVSGSRGLSQVERRAVMGIAAGFSYRELGAPSKQTDNAAQRARVKLRLSLLEDAT